MAAINFYFHVHQPFRLRRYGVFEVGNNHDYFEDPDHGLDKAVIKKIAEKAYLPMNKLLLHLLKKHPDFAVSFSISGVFIDQMQRYAPNVLQSFKDLIQTGRVELIAETYYHSLASIYSQEEFFYQIDAQMNKFKELFNHTPKVFRNTELIYDNNIAAKIAYYGKFIGMLAEGVDRYLDWRSPNFIYHAKNQPNLKLLLKNYKLSDDVAFRFGQKSWSQWPLTAEKYHSWLNIAGSTGDVINLFMDYETFGEHQWADTGIFQFFEKLVDNVVLDDKHFFTTPTRSFELFDSQGEYDVPELTSWADTERDLTAWRGNDMQWDSLETIYGMEKQINQINNPQLSRDWRLLQTSDHFYYMCTKWWNDGDVHAYFSHTTSPYDGYNRFNNAIADLKWRVDNFN